MTYNPKSVMRGNRPLELSGFTIFPRDPAAELLEKSGKRGLCWPFTLAHEKLLFLLSTVLLRSALGVLLVSAARFLLVVVFCSCSAFLWLSTKSKDRYAHTPKSQAQGLPLLLLLLFPSFALRLMIMILKTEPSQKVRQRARPPIPLNINSLLPLFDNTLPSALSIQLLFFLRTYRQSFEKKEEQQARTSLRTHVIFAPPCVKPDSYVDWYALDMIESLSFQGLVCPCMRHMS